MKRLFGGRAIAGHHDYCDWPVLALPVNIFAAALHFRAQAVVNGVQQRSR